MKKNEIKLSKRDAKIFMDAIINPPEPNENLIRAAAEFESKFDNGECITDYLDVKIIDLVKNTTAKFSHFCGGNLYYTIEYNGGLYMFHISTDPKEVGLGDFYSEMKAIYLMRWIRKCKENNELIKIN